ncbi:glycoside hydrolase family 13 protein [Specibacter sp. NPDC057265]|uniref:glycoside hydrolase family 13 protein n=1 Tax=Specibacter sp. NPDC057265 TaxID=3346075 RepID=UPI0036277049
MNNAQMTAAAATPQSPETAPHGRRAAAAGEHHWSRDSVIYQVYPRSFKDANGDGNGDLAGISSELEQLADLGVDALWLSPFYTSPQRDAGYDVADYCQVDPLFGTLADFEQLVAKAHGLGLRIIVDLVPNHCSSEHALFQAALAAEPGSAARDMFIFRDGKGPGGDLPPNNWQSHFGGPAWTRLSNPDGSAGQWYLHLFDSTQPDFNWANPEVHAEFKRILRFWLDRGVDGFRVDVAHALVKAPGLPDWGGTPWGKSIEGFPGEEAPMFGQPDLHRIYRDWREVLAEYGPDRILCAEANVDSLERMSNWVRADQMHHAFNFPYLESPFSAAALRPVIDESLRAFGAVNATSTWVLSNHDVVRHATRFGYDGGVPRDSDGIGPGDEQPDTVLGRRRAAASTLFMLGLPGAVYLYQGEELGLPDHTTLADEFRQDPTFARTGGERIGRDGCRIPLPWRADAPLAGFSGTAHSTPWLPLPENWSEYARDLQAADPASHLNFYRQALTIRKERSLGTGSLQWVQELCGPEVLAFSNGSVVVMLNTGHSPVPLPAGTVLLRSRPELAGTAELQGNEAIWLEP